MLLEYGPAHAEWICAHAAVFCLLVSFCLPCFKQSSPALFLSCCLLLAGYSSLWSASCTCIRAGALAAYRKVAAMAHATITADFDQPLDVHVNFTAQIALDLVFAVNHFT